MIYNLKSWKTTTSVEIFGGKDGGGVKFGGSTIQKVGRWFESNTE